MDNRVVRERLYDLAPGNLFGEPTSPHHAAIYADAVIDILLESGSDQITMSAVARRLRQVPSAVKQASGGRDRFIAMVVGRFAGRWIRWVSHPDFNGVVRVRLPSADEEIHAVRVWSALRELAAGEARAGNREVAEAVAEARVYERKMLVAALRGRDIEVPDSTITTLICLADGLRSAVADPIDPLDPEEAHAIATRTTELLCGSAAVEVPPIPTDWGPPRAT